jgi:hypothetical protein
MKRVHNLLEALVEEIGARTARLGEPVRLNADALDRSDVVALHSPGLWSANRSCRLVRARDGWIAVNLPREEDLAAVPALLRSDRQGQPWDLLAEGASRLRCTDLLDQAQLLGLALSQVGETVAPARACGVERQGSREPSRHAIRVVDFSSLWAGPLCGAVFAAMGADVMKIESAERPDSTATSAPQLDRRLNGNKARLRLPLSRQDGLDALQHEIATCDLLITSARARALTALGLTRERLFAINPRLVWTAITGHGWTSNRVAFGDDAAAAGGLVTWNADEPRFVGDAVADPLTGLTVAAQALGALERGESAFIDAALARTAAYAAKTS